MATNKVQNGSVINYANAGSAISSGDVVVAGTLVGIATVDIASGATGSVDLEGVYTVVKNAGEAWAQGVALYYDESEADFTTTATDNVLAGHAFVSALSAATSGQIRFSN